MPTASSFGPISLPMPDLSQGTPLPALQVDDHQLIAVIPAQALLALVPDPVKAQNKAFTDSDPVLRQYQKLREETQRMFEGSKAKNAIRFGNYIVEGVKGERHFALPSITLYTPSNLVTYPATHGLVVAMIPFGRFFVCIDGETQRRAIQLAMQEHPLVADLMVKVVIHHGKQVEWARQTFHDLNVLEVKPNAAVAVSMDTQDIGTRLTRKVAAASDIKLNLTRRSLKKADPEQLTISALRTGVITTIVGNEGLQRGTRPIGALPAIEDGDRVIESDEEAVTEAVIEGWKAVLEHLEDELTPQRRPDSVVSSPVVLAGIGIVLHRTLPRPPRSTPGELSVEDVIDLLEGIDWARSEKWDGVCGRWSERTRPATGEKYHVLAAGSPKELGHSVADALLHPDSPRGQLIRS